MVNQNLYRLQQVTKLTTSGDWDNPMKISPRKAQHHWQNLEGGRMEVPHDADLHHIRVIRIHHNTSMVLFKCVWDDHLECQIHRSCARKS